MPFCVLADPQAGRVYYPLFWSGPVGTAAGLGTMLYWLFALPSAYAFIVWWYARAGRRSGVQVNVRPFVVTDFVDLLPFVTWTGGAAELVLLPNLAICALVLLVSSDVCAVIERQGERQRARLGILAMASEADKVDFGLIQTTLGLTAGNLSRHLTTLEDAALVRIAKGYEGRRPRTWVSITPAGRKALKKEVQALRDLVARLSDLWSRRAHTRRMVTT